MKVHDLKTSIELFDQVLSGKKTFEYRKNDRNYQVGDILYLKQFNTKERTYTGYWCKVRVTYILTFKEDVTKTLWSNYCIMSIEKLDSGRNIGVNNNE